MAQASAEKLEHTEMRKEVGRRRAWSQDERVKSVRVTRRGGKEASERSGIGQDERQPVMVRLAARWGRSNLVILVSLKKGNHPGEAYVRRSRKKALDSTERNSLERPHEEAEIQRKALRRGKNLAFSKDTCLEKERVRSKVALKKVGVRLERMREPSKRKLGWRWALSGSTEKKEALHLLRLTGRHQYSDQRSNQNRAP